MIAYKVVAPDYSSWYVQGFLKLYYLVGKTVEVDPKLASLGYGIFVYDSLSNLFRSNMQLSVYSDTARILKVEASIRDKLLLPVLDLSYSDYSFDEFIKEYESRAATGSWKSYFRALWPIGSEVYKRVEVLEEIPIKEVSYFQLGWND